MLVAKIVLFFGACHHREDYLHFSEIPKEIDFFPPEKKIEGAPRTSKLSEPLRIIHYTPTGETEQEPVISARFSSPIIFRQDVGKVINNRIFRIEPEVPGVQKWEAQDLLRFYPESEFPLGTVFTVTIDNKYFGRQEHKFLEGFSSWSFTSPRPDVISTVPEPLSEHIFPEQSIFITFNGAMELEEIIPYLHIEAEIPHYGKPQLLMLNDEFPELPGTDYHSLKSFDFQIEYSKENCHKEFACIKITPNDLFSSGSRVRVTLKRGYRSAEGPLPAIEDMELEYFVLEPFRVVALWCDDNPCLADSGISIEFNNTFNSAKNPSKALSLVPRYKGDNTSFYTSWETIHLRGYFKPGVISTLTISGLVDDYGQKIKKTTLTIPIGPKEPSVELDDGFLIIDQRSPHTLTARMWDVQRPVTMATEVSSERVVELLKILDAKQEDSDNYTIGYWKEKWGLKKIKPVIQKTGSLTQVLLPFHRIIEANRPGIVLFQVSADYMEPRRGVVLFTKIGISIVRDKARLLIFVTDLETSEPLKNVQLELRKSDHDDDLLWAGVSDSDGLAKVEELAILSQPGLWLTAFLDNDFSILQVPEIEEEYKNRLVGNVFSDRGLYRPGESILFKGYCRIDSPYGLRNAAKVVSKVRVRLEAKGKMLQEEEIPLNSQGNFNGFFVLPEDAVPQNAKISISLVDPGEIDIDKEIQTTVRIGEYRIPGFMINLNPVQREVVPGDDVQLLVNGRFLHGSPMTGANLTFYSQYKPSSFVPPGYPDVSFVSNEPFVAGSVKRSPRRKLDSMGSYLWLFPLGAWRAPPVTMVIVAEVEDINNQTVSAMTQVLIHPGQFYLGVRLKEKSGEQLVGNPLIVEVLAVNFQGEPYPHHSHINDLKVSFRNQAEESVCEPDLIRDGPVVASCTMVLDRVGLWEIRASAYDSRWNMLVADSTVNVVSYKEEHDIYNGDLTSFLIIP